MKTIQVLANVGDTVFLVLGRDCKLTSIKKLQITKIIVYRDNSIQYFCNGSKMLDCDFRELDERPKMLALDYYYVATEEQMRNKLAEFNLNYEDYINIEK